LALEMREAIGALTETWRRWCHEIGFGIGIAHGFGTLGAICFEGAWLAASAARIAYQMEDESKGQTLQMMDFSLNNNLSPPRIRPVYVLRPAPGRQARG
jgi:hypothetical protein